MVEDRNGGFIERNKNLAGKRIVFLTYDNVNVFFVMPETPINDLPITFVSSHLLTIQRF